MMQKKPNRSLCGKLVKYEVMRRWRLWHVFDARVTI